jgi:hypothetical protein
LYAFYQLPDGIGLVTRRGIGRMQLELHPAKLTQFII